MAFLFLVILSEAKDLTAQQDLWSIS